MFFSLSPPFQLQRNAHPHSHWPVKRERTSAPATGFSSALSGVHHSIIVAGRAFLIPLAFFNRAAGHMRMSTAGLTILGIALMKSPDTPDYVFANCHFFREIST